MNKQDIYQALFHAAPIAMLLSNSHGVICLLNPKAEALFGYSGQELLGEKLELLLGESFSAQQLKQLFSEHPAGSGNNFHVQAKRKNGWTFRVRMQVVDLYLGHDVYKSISVLEEEGGKSGDELYDMLDRIGESAQIIDKDWQYTYANQALLQKCGCSREDLFGHTLGERFPAILDTWLHKTIERCVKQQTEARVESEFSFPDGSPGVFDVLIQPMEQACFIWSTDITRHRQAEEDLKNQNARLQAVNDELKQSAYIVSHDLLEPLRTVAGFVELLHAEYGDGLGETAREYLSYIQQTNKRMQCLVKGLLDFSAAGRKMELSEVNCNELIEQVLGDLKLLIGETKAVIKTEALPALRANDLELRLLFQNLLTNAIKFRRNGVIPEINISCKEYPDYWEFSVRDNGIGIETRHKEKIFMIFQRLHNQDEYEGSGIGLAHCKKVAQLHGGNIWVESEPGAGSCFIFSISRHISQAYLAAANGG